jgi:hypothetical protein
MIMCSRWMMPACVVLVLASVSISRAAEVTLPPDQSSVPNLTAGALEFSHLSQTPAVAQLPGQPAMDANVSQEQAMIPVPSGGKMGMVLLGVLTLFSSRKAIVRFIT